MIPFVPGGPEIPEEIFQALEEDKLVLFCGAGISYYTGLPGFRGLVKKLLPLITNPDKQAIAQAAFNQKKYDKTLDIIENQVKGSVRHGTPNPMRRNLIEALTTPHTGSRSIHKAILEISKLRACEKIPSNPLYSGYYAV
jgi:hypothetical protein